MTRETPTEPSHRPIDLPGAPPIPGLRFRHYAGLDDVEAMVRVCNAARRADGNPEHATPDGFRADYANLTNCDPDRDVLLAEVDGLLVGYGRTFWEDFSDGSRGYHSFGFVDPAWRHMGIGGAMHRALGRRILEIGAGHAFDGPRYLVSWGVDGDVGNTALLRAAGYEPERRFVHMVRPTLEAIGLPPLPDGLEVRPAGPEHAREVFEADAEAFLDHWGGVDTSEAGYERWRSQPTWDPTLWVIAWDADEVAGGCINLIDHAENAEQGYLRGWLDSVFVRRRWRQRGLAKALVGRSLERLRERGMTSAQLGVDVDNTNRALDLYRNAGFEVRSSETAWRRPWPAAAGVDRAE
jgi:ribosomal protein S18 acetylase RimI-like enzyme